MSKHPPGVAVDVTTGCQFDEDSDGVADGDDLCPNTTAQNVDADGCDADTDDDGVIDDNDQCPNTVFNPVDSDGCTLDSDGDGILNSADLCPNTVAMTDVTSEGCPTIDSDGDGVLNGVDSCPETYVSSEFVDSIGCALTDPDDDGVDNDGTDQCPTTPLGSAVGSDGCALDINISGAQIETVVASVGGLIDGTTSTYSPALSFTGTYNPDSNAYSIAFIDYSLLLHVPTLSDANLDISSATQSSNGTVGSPVTGPGTESSSSIGLLTTDSTIDSCVATVPAFQSFFCPASPAAAYPILTAISWDGSDGAIEVQIDLGAQGGVQTVHYTFQQTP
ncbi:thrombospondin type 3 repeat-containing protein [Oceanicoccus sp. KOV_DT_Chl]|uniref:thrombospondin type 3 repeat-containing protein n=1 Tax=Oceanicoccus sp. KOV_DT_Chl TaxID=1904639 RepID=UPI000C7DBE0D|nr:thrombospondin type 3 repeat-containing protein [Oceanicoccus sp. KOV_DT_Chl]